MVRGKAQALGRTVWCSPGGARLGPPVVEFSEPTNGAMPLRCRHTRRLRNASAPKDAADNLRSGMSPSGAGGELQGQSSPGKHAAAGP
jgi:hypothetical protein